VVIAQSSSGFADKPGGLDGLQVVFANPQSGTEQALDAIDAVLKETTA
jgi:hypothetical protein